MPMPAQVHLAHSPFPITFPGGLFPCGGWAVLHLRHERVHRGEQSLSSVLLAFLPSTSILISNMDIAGQVSWQLLCVPCHSWGSGLGFIMLCCFGES